MFYTERFIMFSVITNIYNEKTKGLCNLGEHYETPCIYGHLLVAYVI
jgi:hypothetical protein